MVEEGPATDEPECLRVRAALSEADWDEAIA